MLAAQTFRHEFLNLLSQEFLPAVAEHLLHLRVDQHNLPLLVDHHHGIGRGLEQPPELCLCPLPLRNIDSRSDDVRGCLFGAGQNRGGPGNGPRAPIARDPAVFVLGARRVVTNLLEQQLELPDLFGNQEQIPQGPALDLVEGVARQLLAGPIKADDSAFLIQHHDQRARRIQNGGEKVALLLQGPFRLLELGDIDSDAVNKPRPAILMPDHFGFALKPKHPAVTRHDPVRGSQGFAREEHLRRFHAPSRFVIGVDLLIPAHRVFQPFTLGKTQRCFNLRAYVSFADSLVQVGHEHHSGNLLQQSAVFRFQI